MRGAVEGRPLTRFVASLLTDLSPAGRGGGRPSRRCDTSPGCFSPSTSSCAAVASVQPRAAVVFGSGLADAASPFVATASIPFADVRALVPPTVAGHKGRLSVGHRAGVPAVVSFGRVHFYEGHPWERAARLGGEPFAEFG